MLFHGSRIQNWVGILSRGILLPKIVVSMGVHRTDAGWLGHGIYFGDAACTSVFYTTPGRKKTRLMAIARVALGKMKDYTEITYGLNAPPAGYRQLPRRACHDRPAVAVRRRRVRRLRRPAAAAGVPRRVRGVNRAEDEPMTVKVVLVDINPKMVKAWRATFEENPEVEIVQGSMLDQEVDAWVTPTNARASMDGGLDGVIKGHFGPAIERRVQAEIRRLHGGLLPVGHATCVPTGIGQPGLPDLDADDGGLLGGHQRHAQRGPGLRRGVPGGAHAERPRAGEHRLGRPARPGGEDRPGAGGDLRRPDVDRLQPVPPPGV